MKAQEHGLEQALDHALIEKARISHRKIRPGGTRPYAIRNVHRTVGAMLSGEIARRYGSQGLPDDTIRYTFRAALVRVSARSCPRE